MYSQNSRSSPAAQPAEVELPYDIQNALNAKVNFDATDASLRWVLYYGLHSAAEYADRFGRSKDASKLRDLLSEVRFSIRKGYRLLEGQVEKLKTDFTAFFAKRQTESAVLPIPKPITW